jgi:hypothetical protein
MCKNLKQNTKIALNVVYNKRNGRLTGRPTTATTTTAASSSSSSSSSWCYFFIPCTAERQFGSKSAWSQYVHKLINPLIGSAQFDSQSEGSW